MIYDGSTSLDKAIALDLGLCAVKNIRKLKILKYRAIEALGLDIAHGAKINDSGDKLKIYEWLKAYSLLTEPPTDLSMVQALPVTQSNLEPPLPIEPAIDNVVPVTQKRNKTKRDKRFSGFTRISFNVTGNAQRQHISLEPEFIKALELIAPANRNQWLSDTVSRWIAANGVESSTRIVKCEIVNELIELAKGG
ncbi:MAG: hypothetical protein RL236_2048 [Pseudomonadota bacterium]|jgi:hypothetical protein